MADIDAPLAWRMQQDGYLMQINQLRDENAKLREFIRLKETCWKHVGFCDACPYNGVDEEHYDFNCTVQEDVDSLARELGIEVPDGEV